MTNAQLISLRSLKCLAQTCSPTVDEPRVLAPGGATASVVVDVHWGRNTLTFLIEPEGCIVEVHK